MRNFRFLFSKRIAAWSGAGKPAKKSDKSLAFGRGLLGGSGFRARLKRRLLCETLESRQLLSISQPLASCEFPVVEDTANTVSQESNAQTTITEEELQSVTSYLANTAYLGSTTDTAHADNTGDAQTAESQAAPVASDGSEMADVDISVLPSPENVTASAQNATTVQLNWTASDGASGYKIERLDSPSTEWTVAFSSSNSYTDRWLDSGTNYRYRVYALSGGETSEASDEVSVTTPTANRLLITDVMETETSITFQFSQEIDTDNFERMKDTALYLIPFGESVGSPISASEITYTSLSLTWTPKSGTIPASGNYTLELSAPCFQAEEGGTYLYGGIGGLRFSLVTLGSATLVQQDDQTLQDGSYSVPFWTDWNGDGLSDLVVGIQVVEGSTTVGKVKVHLNSGTATNPKFLAEDAFFVQYQGSDLTVASSGCLGAFSLMSDYDGDGKADLWIGQSDGSIWIYRNTGTASNPLFTTTRVQVKSETEAGYLTENLNVGNRAAFSIADINDDGRMEIYIGNVNGQIFYANEESSLGDGVFSYPQDLLIDGDAVKVDVGRTSPVIVDLNNDGRLDLVVGDTNGYLWFFENVGTTAQATFLEPVLLTTSDGVLIKLSGRSRPTAGDYNGDGRVDLLVGCSDGTVSVFLNEGWGSAENGSIINWDTTSTTFNYVTHLPLSDAGDIVITPTWPTVVTTGEMATFAAQATGGTGTLVYKWYVDDATTPFATSNAASYTFTDYATHTIKLVVSDADGKSSETSRTFVVKTRPSIAVTNPGSHQVNTSVTFTGTLSQNSQSITDLTGWTVTWNFGDESENVNGTLTPAHTYASAGTYTVTMTAVDLDGRSSIATQTIVINADQELTITPVWPLAVVPGQGAAFLVTASGGVGDLSYAWYLDGSDTPFATTSSAAYTFTESGSYSVRIVVTDSETHSKDVTQTITVKGTPVETIADPGTQKIGESTTFVGTLSQDGQSVTDLIGWTISWDFGDGSEKVTGTLTPAHTFVSVGTYTVTMKAIDSEGRSSVVTQSVVVSDSSVIAVTPTWPTAVTVGKEATFAATAGGTGCLTFAWYLGDATEPFATGTSVTHTFDAKGSYSITLKVTDSQSGTASVQKTISVHTSPEASIQEPGAVYAENEYAFTGSLSQDGANVTDLAGWTVTWNFGDGSEAVSGTLLQSHTYAEEGTYTVTMKATDSEGRIGTYERTITVKPASSHWNVTPEIVVPSGMKEGTEATITLKLTDAEGNEITDFTNVTVTWVFSDSNTPVTVTGASTVKKTWTQDGMYTVSVIATNGGGQKTTEKDAAVVVENMAPIVEFIDMPESITAGVPVDLYVKVTDPSSSDNAVVSWYFDGSTTLSNIGTHIRYSFTTSGEHTIRVTANDGTAIGEATITVNVLASKAPTAAITMPGQIVENVEATLNGTLTVDGKEITKEDEAFKDYTVTWNFGDSTAVTTGTLKPVHTYTAVGEYTVTLTIKYNADTSLTSTQTVTVNVVSAVTPTGSITPPSGEIIAGSESTFTGTMMVGGKEITKDDEAFKNYTVTWNFGDGSDVVTGTLNPMHTYPSAGNYTVTMKIVYNADTTISDTKTVKVNVISQVAPVGTITPPDRVVAGEESTFTGSFKVNDQDVTEADEKFGDYTVTWDFGDGSQVVTGTLNPMHTYPSAGNYTVTMKIVYNADTTISNTKTVKVTVLSDKTPTGSITAPDKIVKGDAAAFTGTMTVGGEEITKDDEAFKDYTVTWNFGDGSDVVTGTLNPTHTYTSAGNYTVTMKIVYNADTTISNTVTVSVTVEKSVNEPDLDEVTVTLPEYVVPYQPANLTITVPDDADVTWTATVDWGDGSEIVKVNSKSDLNVWHAYQKTGDYEIKIIVGTQEFTTERTITESLNVRYGISQGADPHHSDETSIFIALSPEQTRVILEQNKATGERWLRCVNDRTKIQLDKPTSGGQLYIYASDQSSSISVTSLVTSKVTIIGGAGNDYILGGSGTNVLVGGEGNDWLFGGVGNGTLLGLGGNDRLITSHGYNVLVGGTGNNRLGAYSGNDLLVAGSTSYDDISASATHASAKINFVAYEAIFSEWMSGVSLSNRQTAITSGVGENDAYKLVPEETVFGVGTNLIVGGHGNSWIVATKATDPIVSLTKPGTITAGKETTFTGSITQNGVKITNTKGWTITWDFGDGSTDTTGTLTPKHTYTKAVSYTVRLTTTDPKGRSGSATKTITVAAASEIAVVPTWPSAVTTGTVTTFKAAATGGSGSYTYKWFLGSATTAFATGSSVNYTFTTSGTYTVKLVVSDTAGKSTTISKEFSVKSAPTLVVTAPESPKANAVGTYTGTITQDGKAVTDLTGWTVEWNFGDQTSKVTGTLTPTHTYAQGGTYTITMTATDSGGRKATKTLSVVVDTSLVVVTWPDAGVEPNKEITCAATPSKTGSEQNYHWLVNGVSAGNESTLKHTFTESGDYIITLEVTEGSKTETITHTVPVKLAPVPVVNNPGNVVVKKDVPFTGSISQDGKAVTALTGWTIKWNFGDQSEVVTGTLTPKHQYASTGEYTVTLTTTDSEGRTGSTTYKVNVIESSNITITPTWPTAVIPNNAVAFSATATGGVGALTYAWYQDNISTPFATTSSVSRAFTAVGTYMIKLVVTGTDGSTASVSKEIVVRTSPTLTLDAPESVKASDGAAFTGTITQNSTVITDLTGWTVTWNFGDESDAANGTLTPVHTYTEAGTYTVTFTATDSDGRTATQTASLVVTTNLVTVEWPTIGVKPNDNITCTANPIDPESELVYTWKIDGAAMSNTSTLIHIFDTAGSYTVTLDVTKGNQTESYTHTIVVKSSPEASITNPGVLTVDETNDFLATLTQDGGTIADLTGWTISWNFGDASDVVTGTLAPEHTYTEAGNYTISFTTTDSEGRMITVTREVVVSEAITLAPTWPSAVTPGKSIDFTVTAEGGTGELTYAWYLDDATEPFATTAEANYTFTDAGTYTIKIKVADSVGLTTTLSHSVLVKSIPGAAIEVPQPAPVNVETTITGAITQDGVPVTDQAGWTVVWNFGDTTSDSTGTLTPKHTYTVPGEYTVTLNATDPEGRAAAVATQTILVEGIAATIDRWSDKPLYPGDQESFSVNVESWGEVSELSYIWSMGSTIFSTDENVEYTFTSAGTHALSLTVTDGTYSSTATMTLTVHAGPTATVTAASSGMTGKDIAFKTTIKQDNKTVTDLQGWTVEWDFGDGSEVETGDSLTHRFETEGTYYVTLTVTDPEGRETSLEHEIAMTQTPEIEVHSVECSVDGIMPEEEVEFWPDFDTRGDVGENLKYYWYLDGTRLSYVSTSQDYVTLSFEESGEHTIKCRVWEGLVYGESEVTVTVKSAPEATLSVSAEVPRVGDEVAFTGVVRQDGQTITDFTNWAFAWNFGGTNTITTTTPNADYKFTSMGTYTVTLTLTDPDGRTNTQTCVVTVQDTMLEVSMDWPNGAQPGSITDFAAAVTKWTGEETLSYYWYLGDSTEPFMEGLEGSFIFTEVGNYAVRFVATDGGENTVMRLQTIHVASAPVATLTTSTTEAKTGETVSLSAAITQDGQEVNDFTGWTFAWNFADGSSDNTSQPDVTKVWSAVGEYTVKLTATDPEGRKTTAEIGMKVTQSDWKAVAAMTAPESISEGSEVELVLSLTDDDGNAITDWTNYQIAWDFGDQTTQTVQIASTVMKTWSRNGMYMVHATITNPDGQSVQTQLAVSVLNVVPVVAFSNVPETIRAGEVVTLDVTVTDPGADSSVIQWYFGGETTASRTGTKVVCTFDAAGDYLIRVTANDGMDIGSVERTFTVLAAQETDETEE
ncbi:MAG: PKD domain-containing protein [Thermoguttaceae bacterium]|nr:PKD domain-containing protein [Thermoguttaceae bacterium]